MTTPITDELVREFLETKHPWEHRYDIWQQFLASKQAKDWEVVRRRRKTHEDHDGIHEPNKWCDECKCEIYEVCRLSDGALFTVGEVTQEGKITKFEIEASTLMWVRLEGVKMLHEFSLLHKLPERKHVLFVTEDGKDLYQGDTYFIVNEDFKIEEHILQYHSFYVRRRFSTRQAAEEYVRDHKPEISRKMVKRALELIDLRPIFINDILNDLDKQLNP